MVDHALPAVLGNALAALPESLRGPIHTGLERLPQQPGLPAPTDILETLPRVWACSDFVARSCVRYPKLLAELERSGDLARGYGDDDHRKRLRSALDSVDDPEDLQRRLRRVRDREMVRIAWRDLAGWAGLEETLKELSTLAEACVDEALSWLYERLCARWGTPRNAAGEAQRLVVLGMGKLGGEELNFSSDIDLIFAYPEAGETDGSRPRANEEFFTKLGRQLIAALDQQTVEGQAFRVDMRLRPYGQSGPLAMSFRAMEIYYQDQGREWERYALIKARVVGGDYERGAELIGDLRPFVYRRYLDYGALESLREMKARVDREVKRKGLEHNIKLGRGGIREIEFIAQAYQLIRGGQERALRERGLLPVLGHLVEHGQIPRFAYDELVEGYAFLRRTENRLQAAHDRQTHELPDDATERLRLAYAMGFGDWETFHDELTQRRHKIQGHFDQVFVAPQNGDDAGADERFGLSDVWQETLDDDEADELLHEAGFERPAKARDRLKTLRDSRATRALSARGRARLERLMPMLLAAVAADDHPDVTLERVVLLLEAIVRRTAYLSLLNEHPTALSQLVQLCAGSPWIARFLTRHPVLLDELLDPRSLYAPLGRDALTAELEQRLQGVAEDDLEAQMEVLRHFKQTNTLRVAAADLGDAVPLMVVSDYLTELAEVVLEAVLRMAWAHMRGRYGRPVAVVDGESVEQGLAIVAYGKLGSIELGYGSDLDLVFVHDNRGEQRGTDGRRAVENSVFFARLAQRIIHILNTPTPGGILYEVDTRLRPSGKSGLLTASIDAFADYQRHKAWTWEHQALVRARVVAGSRQLGERIEAIRREVLGREREAASLRDEVRAMRARMRREKAAHDPDVFDLKQDSGGIADIEFMVQYGALAGAHANPGLMRFTDNMRLLDELSRNAFLSPSQARRLADAYRCYRARVHRLTLQERASRVPRDELATSRETVTALWSEIMGGNVEQIDRAD